VRSRTSRAISTRLLKFFLLRMWHRRGGTLRRQSRYSGQETAAGLKAAFGLSKADEIRTLLVEAGFKRIEMTVKQLDLELLKRKDFVPRHISATPAAAGFNAASEIAQQAVVREASERLARYETNTPFRSHLAMATK